jgi:hypothetical protein
MSATPNPEHPDTSVLVVVGTNGKDKIRIVRQGNRGEVTVFVNNQKFGVFMPTGGILVMGLDGNDDIKTPKRLDVPVETSNSRK